MKKLLLSLLLAFSCVVYSQDQVFKVLIGKESQVKYDKSYTDIIRGDQIRKGATFKVNSGGYLALLHITGRTIELKTPGTYKISDLESKINTKTMSFSQKYAQFASNQISSQGNSMVSSMNTSGAVTRGAEKPARFCLPDSLILLPNESLEFEFKGPVYAVSYISDSIKKDIVVTNGFSILIDKSLVKNSFSLVLKDSNGYVISDVYNIAVLSGDNLKSVQTQLDSLSLELEPNSSADLLVLAEYYRQNKLYNSAKISYENALFNSKKIIDYFYIQQNFVNEYYK